MRSGYPAGTDRFHTGIQTARVSSTARVTCQKHASPLPAPHPVSSHARCCPESPVRCDQGNIVAKAVESSAAKSHAGLSTRAMARASRSHWSSRPTAAFDPSESAGRTWPDGCSQMCRGRRQAQPRLIRRWSAGYSEPCSTLKHFVGRPADRLHDRVAVSRSCRERAQDQKVESAL